MRDITHKHRTLRTATAQGELMVGESGYSALENGEVPKGNPFAIAETAALSGVKETPELIPHCHSIRIENVEVEFELTGDAVRVTVRAEAGEKTGVEMEALTAVSVALLNLYDLLKPIEDDIQIGSTKLVSKSGGYSDFRDKEIRNVQDLTAGVLVTSDSTYEGNREDKSGKLLRRRLEAEDFEVVDYTVLPDEPPQIREYLLRLSEDEVDFIATTGGTGPGPRDVTVEATEEIVDRQIPGLAETMRSYGQDRTPYAMFSRGVAGQRGRTLIVNFPGSSNGTREGLDALFPGLHHFFMMREKKE